MSKALNNKTYLNTVIDTYDKAYLDNKFLNLGAPNVTTQLNSVSSNLAASTQFVRSIGGAKSSVTTLTTTSTLNASDASGIKLLGGTGSYTVTLPLAALIPNGFIIDFINTIDFPITINRNGTDTIQNQSSVNSIVLHSIGYKLSLMSNGIDKYIVIFGGDKFESQWTTTLPSANSVTTFTHTLGTKPTSDWIIAENVVNDGSFVIGDRIIMPLQGPSPNGYAMPFVLIVTTTSVIISRSGGNLFATPKTGGDPIILTPASWKYKVFATI